MLRLDKNLSTQGIFQRSFLQLKKFRTKRMWVYDSPIIFTGFVTLENYFKQTEFDILSFFHTPSLWHIQGVLLPDRQTLRGDSRHEDKHY